MMEPRVLGIDPAEHAIWASRGKALKKALGESTGTERAAAKAAFTAFLNDEVAPALKVPEASWERYQAGFSGAQTKAVFSTALMVFALVMIVSGRWQDRAGPRPVALFGCVLLGLSYLAASRDTTSFPWVLFWVGVVGGAGIGCAYVCPIAACLKWFPKAKGPITGLAVAGFGAGAYVFINLAGSWAGLLSRGGVPLAFRTFGLIFLAVGGTGALLLANPPSWERPVAGGPSAGPSGPELDQSESVRTPTFWLLWSAFMLSSGSGLMIISALKDFGVAEGGMSEAAADQALGLLALFNGLGRISWGTLGQTFSPRRAAVALMLLQAAMLLSLPLLGASVLLLALGGCWVGFQFGGNLSLFPLLTAERFGLRHLGANYGLVFTAYGVGGVVGPLLAGSVWDALGSYRWAFWAAAAASLAASALIVSIRRDPLDIRGTEPPGPPPGAW
jgi:OFA family oxalate/formate antiporter-like MFS transporter